MHTTQLAPQRLTASFVNCDHISSGHFLLCQRLDHLLSQVVDGFHLCGLQCNLTLQASWGQVDAIVMYSITTSSILRTLIGRAAKLQKSACAVLVTSHRRMSSAVQQLNDGTASKSDGSCARFKLRVIEVFHYSLITRVGSCVHLPRPMRV